MGSSHSKFKKYLQHGDEFAAMQVYQNSIDLRENFDPNISYGDSHNQNTPLHYAAKHGMKHLVRAFLFDHGGNPNKKNSDGENAFHVSCQVGQAKSPSAEERRTACVALMLQWRGGSSMDIEERETPELMVQDKNKNTALHYAAMHGLKKCVDLLFSHGADLFVENKDKLTPCHMAVKEKHYDVAAYLEARMVFVNADNADSCSDTMSCKTFGTESDEVYAGLRPQDLQEAKDDLLVETADMLRVPLFTAEALLRDNEWSKTMLLEKWMSNAVQCCEMAGVAPPTSALSPSPPVGETPLSSEPMIITPLPPPDIPGDNENRKLLCEICYEEMFPWEITNESPTCGHKFCLSCWESYLSLKILEGGAFPIFCPASDCSIIVDVDFIEKIVSPDVARKYLQYDIEAFVERNKTIKWCPLPGCGRAVRYPEVERSIRAFYFPNMNPPPKTSHAVDCGNGHFFCWECLGEAHSPCGCDQWLLWQRKIAEVKAEELNITSEETENAANLLWLVTNSKPCPNCKSPIQKNEGCNHVKCSKCKHDFCWICLEAWKKHSSVTGGYFRCNRYDAQGKADDKFGVLLSEAAERNEQMQELSRFVHYYTRFKKHQNSLHLEEPLLRMARSKMAILANSLPFDGITGDVIRERGTRFVEDSMKELLKARRVLCGSYVYGFYLQDNGYNKIIFEYMQNELEELTEKLSDIVAKQYLTTPRSQIINTTLLTRRRRHKFVGSVARGLLPPETPPALRKANRRKFPGLADNDIEMRCSTSAEGFGRHFDPAKQWIKDSSGQHTNLGAILDWPDLDSDEEENSLNQALTMTLLGKCSRKLCQRPRARNPRTGAIHDFCSLRCAQQNKFRSNHDENDTSACAWEGCDSNMELLIALEMSRLQMIEDEARRRQSLLQEHSRDRLDYQGENLSSKDTLRDHISRNHIPLPNRLGANTACTTSKDSTQYFKLNMCPNADLANRARSYIGEKLTNIQQGAILCPPLYSNDGCHRLSSAEIAVDFFLKKLSNNEISIRNLNSEIPEKVDKNLFCAANKEENPGEGLHYGAQNILASIYESNPELRRSQSLGDLLDMLFEGDATPNFDLTNQDRPEVNRLSKQRQDEQGSLDLGSEADVESTDQGASSAILGEMDSPLTDMEIRGILEHLDGEPDPEPAFQLVIDEGTDKDDSTDHSTRSGPTPCKNNSLRIKIERGDSSQDISETGIPNSPTLYISGVSISRSPEPRSPKCAYNKENRSPTLVLPLSRTPEPKMTRLLSPIQLRKRSRSSSLIVPDRICSRKSPSINYLDTGYLNLSSVSLQGTRASSPFFHDMRVSRSASETEKGRLMFQFPKSPTEGALSSVLHVEESALSSDDFHEALFFHRLHGHSRRKKSKKERNKNKMEKDDDILPLKSNNKDRKKLSDFSNIV